MWEFIYNFSRYYQNLLFRLNCCGLILVMNENACFPTASIAQCVVKLLDICQSDRYHYLTISGILMWF